MKTVKRKVQSDEDYTKKARSRICDYYYRSYLVPLLGRGEASRRLSIGLRTTLEAYLQPAKDFKVKEEPAAELDSNIDYTKLPESESSLINAALLRIGVKTYRQALKFIDGNPLKLKEVTGIGSKCATLFLEHLEKRGLIVVNERTKKLCAKK